MDNSSLKRLESLIKVAGEDVPTRQEVAGVMKTLVSTVRELLGTMDDRIGTIDKDYRKADEDLHTRVETEENARTADVAAVRQEIKTIALTPGKPGKDADPEDVKRRVLAEIEIPKPADGSPDTPVQVRDKLETLEGDDRLNAKAISGLEDLVRQLMPKGDNGGVRVIGGRAGIQMYIDGAKVGLVQTLNLLAGSGITFDYLNKSGVLTLTVNSTGGGGGGTWYLGEQITLDGDAKTFHLLHAPTAKLEVLLDRQPQIMGLDISGTIDGANKDFSFVDAVDPSLFADIYANYL